MTLGTLPALFQQVVDLALDRVHFYFRIHQTRRPDDLFNYFTARLRQFIWTRRRRHVNRLSDARFKLGEVKRPVVERRR